MTTVRRHSDSSHLDSLYAAEWLPVSPPRGAFLLLHGMESHTDWFLDLASALCGAGWAVLAYDRSGWGKSPGRRGHLGSYRHFVEEALGVARRARERFPALHLAGLSWGGMASLYLALRRGWMFDSVSLIAPGLATRRDLGWADRAGVARAWLGGDPLRPVRPQFSPEDFTADPGKQRFIAEDRHRVREVTAAFCIETVKMRRFIAETAGRRLTPPLLALLAERDVIVDNARTASLCRRAGASLEMLPDCRHSLVLERPSALADLLASHARAAQEARAARSRRAWVVGGGAVGGAVAALLSFAGVTTGLAVKPASIERYRAGLALHCGAATRITDGALIPAAGPRDLPDDPELLVFAVKSFDTRAAAEGLVGRIPPGCVVTTLQNGVGNEAILASLFPDNPLVAAAICAGLEMPKPGEASLADDRGGLGGAWYRGGDEAAMRSWAEILSLTGMECRWYAGAEAAARLKWSKLMLNVGFNALNSLTGQSSAALLRDPRHGRLAVAALREGFRVMAKQGLSPCDLPGYPVSALARVVRLPADWARRIMAWQAGRATEAAFSMRQDVVKGRPGTEIEELNGRVAATGRELGIATPANARLTALIRDFYADRPDHIPLATHNI